MYGHHPEWKCIALLVHILTDANLIQFALRHNWPKYRVKHKIRLVKLVRQSPHRTLIQSIKELFYVERLESSPSADRIRQWQRIRRNCKQICGKQNSVDHDLRVFFIGSVARVWTNHDGTRCWLPQWMRFYFFCYSQLYSVELKKFGGNTD